jgi:transposase
VVGDGYTDMRCGFPSLAPWVQEMLKHDPLGGHLFCFRRKRGDLIQARPAGGRLNSTSPARNGGDYPDRFFYVRDL